MTTENIAQCPLCQGIGTINRAMVFAQGAMETEFWMPRLSRPSIVAGSSTLQTETRWQPISPVNECLQILKGLSSKKESAGLVSRLEIKMLASMTTAQLNDIYTTLGQLIKNPKSLGLRKQLPPRVLAALTSTREFLLEEMDGKGLIVDGKNDLAAELSHDADTQHGIPEEEKNKMSFHQLLCRRMQQLRLSNYDVAVSLGSTIQHVSDLTKGIKAPTDLDIAELALLLGVTQENLARCAQRKIESLAATV